MLHFSQIHGTDFILFFQAQPSTSGTSSPPVSATERKFGYREVEADDAVAAPDVIAAAIVRTTVLSALVENLACTLCGSRTLIIHADENLGMICKLQTFCTTCEEVINSTHSSDRVGGSRSSSPVRRDAFSGVNGDGCGCRLRGTRQVLPFPRHACPTSEDFQHARERRRCCSCGGHRHRDGGCCEDCARGARAPPTGRRQQRDPRPDR